MTERELKSRLGRQDVARDRLVTRRFSQNGLFCIRHFDLLVDQPANDSFSIFGINRIWKGKYDPKARDTS